MKHLGFGCWACNDTGFAMVVMGHPAGIYPGDTIKCSECKPKPPVTKDMEK